MRRQRQIGGISYSTRSRTRTVPMVSTPSGASLLFKDDGSSLLFKDDGISELEKD